MSAHLLITLDGETLMDGELGDWVASATDRLGEHLQPGSVPPPWVKALMFAMADAAVRGGSLAIDITRRGGGWTMSVDDAA